MLNQAPTNKCKLNDRNSPFCYSQCITNLDSYHLQMTKLLDYYLLGNLVRNAPSPWIPDGTWIHGPILEPLNVSYQLRYWLWLDAMESVRHLPLSHTYTINWNLGQDTSILPQKEHENRKNDINKKAIRQIQISNWQRIQFLQKVNIKDRGCWGSKAIVK